MSTTYDTSTFLEVHLTQTGADLVYDGATVQTIDLAPQGNYRFGCSTYEHGAGFTDLSYKYARNRPPPPPRWVAEGAPRGVR